MPAPTLSDLQTDVTFGENLVNAAPQLLDSNVIVSDPEGNFNGSVLTVTGLLAEDRVSLRNVGNGSGEIGLSGTTVTYGGTTIGAVSGGVGETLTVTLNAAATTAAVDALIENLTYANVSDGPTATRTLVLDLTDAAGGRLNAQAATFADSGYYVPLVGEDPVPVYVDFDSDGDLDLVTGFLDGHVQTFRNDGTAFTDLTDTPADPFTRLGTDNWNVPAFADLDGDGDQDLVTGSFSGTLRVFRNDRAGGFVELTGADNPLSAVNVGFSSAPAFADIDGDGDMDAVVGNEDGTLAVFRNDGVVGGKLVFTALTGANNPFDGVDVGASSRPTFVDLDGDGDRDGLVGAEDGGFTVLRNNGNGTFTRLDGNPFDGLVDGNGSAAFFDYDGDGDLDAYLGLIGDGLAIYENVTKGGVAITVTVTSEPESDKPDDKPTGKESIDGGGGKDKLLGSDGDDMLRGFGGKDTLNGGKGKDTMMGGVGDDVYRVDSAGDVVMEDANGGVDHVKSSVSYTLTAGSHVEELSVAAPRSKGKIDLIGNKFAQTITGNDGANLLNGRGGDDKLVGRGGADTLIGGAGKDTLEGGAGDDLYKIDAAGDVIVEGKGTGKADRATVSVSFALAGDDDIEILDAAVGKKRIDLTGNDLAQTITGNGGANVIDGRGGADTLKGGKGADSFVFSTAFGASNVDKIIDFDKADTIRLDDAIFTGLAKGTLADAAFTANANGRAVDATDRIVYETDTGNLYFDIDGAGAAAPIMFAKLQPNLSLTAADFVVF